MASATFYSLFWLCFMSALIIGQDKPPINQRDQEETPTLKTSDTSERRPAAAAYTVSTLTTPAGKGKTKHSRGSSPSSTLVTRAEHSHSQLKKSKVGQQVQQFSTGQGKGEYLTVARVIQITHNSTSECMLAINQSSDTETECGPASKLSTPCIQISSVRIKWSGNGSRFVCIWKINASSVMPDAVGMVLHFEETDLQSGLVDDKDDIVWVYQGPELLNDTLRRRVRGSLPVQPLLIPSDLATVRLEARSEQHGSRFVLRVTAYPLDKLPPEASSVGPLTRYNCSPPYIVPEALRCDMVEQCIEGQDERAHKCTCQDCDGYKLLGNHVHKFIFPDKDVSPQEAKTHCNRGAADLGELLDPQTKLFAARVTALSGHNALIVNLAKFRDETLRRFPMYRFLWRWEKTDQLEVDGPLPHAGQGTEKCAILKLEPTVHFKSVRCWRKIQAGYICSIFQGYTRSSSTFKAYPVVPSVSVSTHFRNIHFRMCPDGSVVQTFHPCSNKFSTPIEVDRLNPTFRTFLCKNMLTIRYTLLCDGRDDCLDGSDERNCGHFQHRSNRGLKKFFQCTQNLNPVVAESRCNGQIECFDGSDEDDCLLCQNGTILYPGLGCLPEYFARYNFHEYFSDECSERQLKARPLRKLVLDQDERGLQVLQMDGYGLANLITSNSSQCPFGYWLCSYNMCIPIFLVRNTINDCPYPSVVSSNFNCSGFYRCYATKVCLDPVHLCDGVIHCPNRDDELYCNMTCPESCECEGHEFKCRHMYDPANHPLVSYLDISGVSQPPLHLIDTSTFLRFLNMSSCGLTNVVFNSLSLRVIDLSHNRFVTFKESRFPYFMTLEHLILSGNPLSVHLSGESFQSLTPRPQYLLSLDLSGASVKKIDSETFSGYIKLKHLDLSSNPVEEFALDSLKGLANLQTLVADDQRLCCLYEKELLRPIRCMAPEDELSSCSDLLRSPFLRVTLWLQAVMAVAGNAGVLVSRLFFSSLPQAPGFRVLVINLSVADLLMGVYLVLVGAADAHYIDRYLWTRHSWIHSHVCRAAGFLSLLSSEVSVFIICLITLDRFLVLRFPFRRQLHLTLRSASAVCAVAWALGVLLAGIPLLPPTQHWNFYSQTGICLPLPITRHQFPGQHYSFFIFIVFNFVLFLLIGAGQLAIYQSVHSTKACSNLSQRRQQDTAIARRLFAIVFTDFCCWFPVGVMGILAAQDIPIPGQLNVWTAVFVLPLNSALNPFLYTLNGLLEKRRQRREEERAQGLVKRLRTDILAWPEDTVMQCYQIAAQRLGKEIRGPSGSVDRDEFPENVNSNAVV